MEQELTTMQKLNVLLELECKSKSTINTYERHIEKFVNYYGKEPEQKHIINYLYYLKIKKNYDKSSLNVVRSALLYYYKEVLNQEIMIKIPSQTRRKSIPQPLPKEVIKMIIDNTSNLKYKLLFKLAYDGGFRPKEIVSLKWEDVNWWDKSIIINRGKGDKDRLSFISENVMNDLKEYKEIQKKINQNSTYIFDSQQRPDYHICKRSFSEKMKEVAKKLGIEMKIYPYRLRHSFGSHMKESGEPVEDIQPRMGHSNIKTTLGYARVAKPREDMKSPMDDPYFNEKVVIGNS